MTELVGVLANSKCNKLCVFGVAMKNFSIGYTAPLRSFFTQTAIYKLSRHNNYFYDVYFDIRNIILLIAYHEGGEIFA